MKFFSLVSLFLSAACLSHASEILSVIRATPSQLGSQLELPSIVSDLEQALCFYTLHENGTPTTYTYLRPNNLSNFLQKYTQNPLLKNYEITVGDQGLWIASHGTITKPQRIEFLAHAATLPDNSALFGRLYFNRLLEAIKKEARLTDQQDPLKLLPGLAELIFRDIQTVEFSLRNFNRPIRLVGVVEARPNSALAELFSQRLPKIRKDFLEQFATNDAAVFGYMLYNTSAVLKYRGAVQSRLPQNSDLVSKVAIQMPANQLLNSDGINVTVVDDRLNGYFATLGHWSEDSTLGLLEAQSQIAQRTEGGFMQTQSAFIVGDAPVWSTRLNGEPVGFTALSDGDLYTSSAAVEDFSAWLRSTQQLPSSKNIYTAFNHYPTVCAQLMIKPQRLYGALIQRYPVLQFAQGSITNEDIYMAASIHNGRLGISVDLPQQAVKLGIKNLTQRFLK